MQAERIFYHRPLTDKAVYRPIRYGVLAMIIAAAIVQSCRSGLQYSFSSPSSGAGSVVQGSRSFSDTLLVTGANAGDFTLAGRAPLVSLHCPPGFSQSNHHPVASADSMISFVPLNAGILGDATAFGKDATNPVGPSRQQSPTRDSMAVERLLKALILAAPEGEGCKAASDVPAGASGSYYTKMIVTAYCPLKCCCGLHADSFTASGHKIQPGRGERFAAAPRQYPFGTIFDIPGYGRAECLDRGGAIRGNKLDLYFDTHTQARAWGIKTLIVKVTEAMY